MAKKTAVLQQLPRVLFNWNSAGRQYRAVILPSTNSIIVQTVVENGWMLLATPMPASWEQSLIVVAMRLAESVSSTTTGKARRKKAG